MAALNTLSHLVLSADQIKSVVIDFSKVDTAAIYILCSCLESPTRYPSHFIGLIFLLVLVESDANCSTVTFTFFFPWMEGWAEKN